MKTLYEIIKQIQSASGSNEKIAILQENKENELLKNYLKAVYDPAISYYISKSPRRTQDHGEYEFSQGSLDGLNYHLAERNITGNMAANWLQNLVNNLNKEGQELLELLIKRNIGAGVGETIVLKIFPKLFLVPAYMRCSLSNEKTLKPFHTSKLFAIQKKADGAYNALYTSGKAYTRNGNAYPKWLVDCLLAGKMSDNTYPNVLLGEVTVKENSTGKTLNRQIGNGLLNSILKGADQSEFTDYTFIMECWDMLSVDEFEQGFSDNPYKQRFDEMSAIIDWEYLNLLVIDTYFVHTLEEAYAINTKHMEMGFEGSVIKTLDHKWKDHTSPFNVKLKVKFQIDLRVTGMYEGTGKAAGMLGGVNLESSDGLLKTNCGSGFDDKTRIEMWNNSPVGSIFTIEANDILTSRNTETASLFLPIFQESRLDKIEADNFEHCQAQLIAAKG